MSRIQVVVGGQFGSEAKGHVAAHLAKGRDNLVAIRVAGPNAGHTAYDDQGRKWALRQIPVMAVVNTECVLVLGPGSEIEWEVLESEIKELENAGFSIQDRLFIDRQATMLEERHHQDEATLDLVARAGSTGKGVGAARADRILRRANLWGQHTGAGEDTIQVVTGYLNADYDLIIEGTQGYGLGLHAGWYPHCTSSDCRVVDFLAMAGIPVPSVHEIEPWVVIRTFPIRIAGNSGPMYRERDWADLAGLSGNYIQPEYTTVTKKQRRIGDWDTRLAGEAVAANGGDLVNVALTFFDYWFPELAGVEDKERLTPAQWSVIYTTEQQCGAPIRMLGTGPQSMIVL